MSEEQIKITKLIAALGKALGALEVVNLSPYDFNKDGVLHVIQELKRPWRYLFN